MRCKAIWKGNFSVLINYTFVVACGCEMSNRKSFSRVSLHLSYINSILHSAGGLKQLPLRRIHVTPEVTLITSGGLRRLDVYASFGIRVSFCLGVFIAGDDAGHVFDVEQRIRLVLERGS